MHPAPPARGPPGARTPATRPSVTIKGGGVGCAPGGRHGAGTRRTPPPDPRGFGGGRPGRRHRRSGRGLGDPRPVEAARLAPGPGGRPVGAAARRGVGAGPASGRRRRGAPPAAGHSRRAGGGGCGGSRPPLPALSDRRGASRHRAAGADRAAAWRLLSDLCAGRRFSWPQGASGPAVWHLAREHRLAARAGGRLAAGAGKLPSDLAEAFLRRHREVLGEQALFEEALGAIDRAAGEAGTEVVVLKGADLARRIYPSGERPHNDLDLLVRPEDAGGLWRRLASGGFAPEGPEPERRRDWFASTLRWRRAARVQVDLHWQLGTPGRTRWDAHRLFARAERWPGAEALHRLAAPDLAVHLASHAVSFHGASGRRIWWLDLFLLGDLLRSEAVRRRAREVGARVCLEAADLRARELFGGERSPRRGRAGLVARLGAAAERAGGGRAARWAVAALAVDRPGDLIRAVRHVAARPLRRLLA
ncbi:MAG: hypothetical protein D6718_06635 [Acidobacteria bacterium]|nr:MAG: hypothetical protein D6718_06635 [Acidobacteriota bacterium]